MNASDFVKLARENAPVLYDRDTDGQGVLFTLARLDRVDLVTILAHQQSLRAFSAPDRFQRVPLHYAQSENMAKLLWYTDVVITDAQGRQKIVPSRKVRDNLGRTPFLQMAARGYAPAMSYALSQICRRSMSLWSYLNGDPINEVDADHRNALHLAALSGTLSGTNALLECSSIPLNQVDKYQRTPLHYAAARAGFGVGNTILLYSKIRHENLNTNQTDVDGHSAMGIARICRNTEAEQIFLANNIQDAAPQSIDDHQILTNLACGSTIASSSLH